MKSQAIFREKDKKTRSELSRHNLKGLSTEYCFTSCAIIVVYTKTKVKQFLGEIWHEKSEGL